MYKDSEYLSLPEIEIINLKLYSTMTTIIIKFMDSLIEHLKSLGRIRTSETYKSTLNSFRRFREGRDLSFHQALTMI